MTSQPKFTAVELVAGKAYRVVTLFEDYDGTTHEVGESWRYVGKNFLPYEDGLTLLLDAGETRQLRLQWRPETQAHIIEHFSGLRRRSVTRGKRPG